jgi:hypothetical protein
LDDLENRLYIPVPDEVYKEWFEQNVVPAFEDFLGEEVDGIEVLVVEE